jgi:RecA/RadA recombinase
MGIAQRAQGAICALIDTEHAWSVQFVRDICHANPDDIYYLDPENLEDCWDAADTFITRVRERDQKRPIFIGIDSLAGLPSKEEDAVAMDEFASMASGARVNKKAMRKLRKRISVDRASIVMVNQEIAKIGVTFGEKTTTSGGSGPRYFSSVRLQTDQLGKVWDGDGKDKELIGIRYRVTIYKNRFAGQGPHVDFTVDFKRGIDDVDSVCRFLKERHQLGNEAKGRLVWGGNKLTLNQLKDKARADADTWEQLRALAAQTVMRSPEVEDDDSEGAADETVEGVA